MRASRMLGLVVLVLLSASAFGQRAFIDLDSCHDDLDEAHRAASDASNAAEDAHSKAEEFDDCKSNPDVFDLMHDGCQSQRSDYESAIRELDSDLDDLDSRLDGVQTTCGYQFSINRISSGDAAQRHLDAAQQRLCSSYKSFLTMLTLQNVNQMCKAQQGEEWCKSCLGQ